jgi:hypothetical protein
MPPPMTQRSPAFVCRAEALATDYVVYVHAPEPLPPGSPAVLFLDGDYIFDRAVETYSELRRAGAIPPAFIAAVGYGRPFGDPRNRRGRDYTQVAAAEEPGSGGADAFLRFVAQELWPQLESRYRLGDAERVLSGHSLSALCALHALFQPQPFFRRVLAGAPSIWWADRALLGSIAKFRARHARLDAKLYLGIGAEDTESMRTDLAALERQLQTEPFAGLDFHVQRFPGREHVDVIPELLAAGLSWLLRP